MGQITLTLSWPIESSLNSRIHWAKRSEINSANVLEGMVAAKEAYNGILPKCNYSAVITFCPPDRRRRDLDNMLARIKKQLDSACFTWGVDDSCIKRITLEWGYPVQHGSVIVMIDAL